MKKLSIALSVLFTICMIACKKKDNIVNFRDKYLGIYRVYINSHGGSYYNPNNPYSSDTSYSCEVLVRYDVTDSIFYSPTPRTYLPAISIYYLNNVLFKKLGIKEDGSLYEPYYQDKGYSKIAIGGFVGNDSINVTLSVGTNHTSYTDTIKGHKL